MRVENSAGHEISDSKSYVCGDNLRVTSCTGNNTTPQIKFDALTLAARELNAACSEGVAVATRSLSQGEGSCHC